jgi:D-3-phosphoglycerate dehydrogenase
MRVSQLLGAVLNTLDRELRVLGNTANGDVMQALAMALAVRTAMLHAPYPVGQSLATALAVEALAAAGETRPMAPAAAARKPSVWMAFSPSLPMELVVPTMAVAASIWVAFTATADFVTIHVAKTPETAGLLDAERLAKAKPGLRIINVARGGIVVEADLAAAIASGHLGGAALDVFDTEPTTASPLFELPNVVVTPHLGASTVEAQDKAGVTIAEQVGLALAGEFVPFAVNVSAAEANETLRPFLPLAERLGALFASLTAGASGPLEIDYQGQLGGYDNRILTLSVLKGFFGRISDEPVSYVNAPALADAHGIEVREVATTTTVDFVNLITLRRGEHTMSGTLAGHNGEARLVAVDGHGVDLPPSPHMLVVRNEDRPGMIGVVGTVLGEAGLNIADMDVGRSPTGAAAMMVVATTEAVPTEVAEALRAVPGIVSVHSVDL